LTLPEKKGSQNNEEVTSVKIEQEVKWKGSTEEEEEEEGREREEESARPVRLLPPLSSLLQG